MASKLAVAQRKEAALDRIVAALAGLGVIMDPPATGKADPSMALAITLESVADALETAGKPKGKKAAKQAEEITEVVA